MSGLSQFFSSAGFLPHGFCLLWRPDILALHAISDGLIAASYFSIPLAIVSFVRRRSDLILEHRRIAVLFSLFILSCGLTHVMSVVLLWQPLYVYDGLLKAFTALVSIVAALALWPVIPHLLAIPSPHLLEEANASLRAEVAAKLQAVGELEAVRSNLEAEVERRVRELNRLARRFQVATEGSLVTVTEQDQALRYLWLHNPAPPLTEAAIGLTDGDLLDAETAASLIAAKQGALESGQPLRTELVVHSERGARFYDLRVTPSEVSGDARGLLTAWVDITEQRRQQEHLRVIMHELAHRAKNLLSLVEGIARQMAKVEDLPSAFIKRFGARLSALGSAHDLLIGRDWHGIDLATLIEAQLAFILPEVSDRISLNGPEVTVSPQVGQYLALAVHELATNATKHGVFSAAGGALSVTWRRLEDPEARVELVWRETCIGVEAPGRTGFGRLLLETIVPRALAGEGDLSFTLTGVVWTVRFAP